MPVACACASFAHHVDVKFDYRRARRRAVWSHGVTLMCQFGNYHESLACRSRALYRYRSKKVTDGTMVPRKILVEHGPKR